MAFTQISPISSSLQESVMQENERLLFGQELDNSPLEKINLTEDYMKILNNHNRFYHAIDVFARAPVSREMMEQSPRICSQMARAYSGIRAFIAANVYLRDGISRAIEINDRSTLMDLVFVKADIERRKELFIPSFFTLVKAARFEGIKASERAKCYDLALEALAEVGNRLYFPEQEGAKALSRVMKELPGWESDSQKGEVFARFAQRLYDRQEYIDARTYAQSGRQLALTNNSLGVELLRLEGMSLVGQKQYKSAFTLASLAESHLKLHNIDSRPITALKERALAYIMGNIQLASED